MMYLRDDGIWEIECSECQLKLTEIVTGPLPVNGPAAKTKAFNAGWEILEDANLCVGCANVY